MSKLIAFEVSNQLISLASRESNLIRDNADNTLQIWEVSNQLISLASREVHDSFIWEVEDFLKFPIN